LQSHPLKADKRDYSIISIHCVAKSSKSGRRTELDEEFAVAFALIRRQS